MSFNIFEKQRIKKAMDTVVKAVSPPAHLEKSWEIRYIIDDNDGCGAVVLLCLFLSKEASLKDNSGTPIIRALRLDSDSNIYEVFIYSIEKNDWQPFDEKEGFFVDNIEELSQFIIDNQEDIMTLPFSI